MFSFSFPGIPQVPATKSDTDDICWITTHCTYHFMATNANSFQAIKYSSGITSVYKLNTSLQGPEHISLCQGIWKNTWDWYDSELHAAQSIGQQITAKWPVFATAYFTGPSLVSVLPMNAFFGSFTHNDTRCSRSMAYKTKTLCLGPIEQELTKATLKACLHKD